MNPTPETEKPAADPAVAIPGEGLSGRDLLLLAVACIPIFVALGTHQCWGAEGRVLGIALSMREKGSWLTPDLYGENWWFRPLLYFWCAAVSSFFTGGVTELAGRLPAAISGAATIFITAHVAARLVGRRAAVPAGWLYATAFSTWAWSRTAAMDTMNVAFAAAAVAIYVESIPGFKRWHIFAFAAVIGLGSQAKGVPALVLPCAIGFADAVLNRRKDLLRFWPWIAAAVPVAAALFSLSLLIAVAHGNGRAAWYDFYRENIQRVFDPYDHKDQGIHLYFWVVPLLFLPWGLSLPAAIAAGARRWKADRGWFFAFTAFAVTFALFSASASRRSYYILPVFPWCAVLLAAMLDSFARKRESGEAIAPAWKWLGEGPLFLVFAVAPLAGLALCIARFLPGNPGKAAAAFPLAPLGGLLILASAAAFWISRRRAAPRTHLLVAAGALFPVYLFASIAVDGLRDRFTPERSFAQEVRRKHPSAKLLYYHAQNSRLFWQLREAPDADDPEELKEMLLKQGGSGIVVADARYRKQIEQSPLFEAVVETESAKPDIPYRRQKDAYVQYRVTLK